MFLNIFKKIEAIFFPQSDYMSEEKIHQEINQCIYFPKNKEVIFFSYKNKKVRRAIWDLKFRANTAIVSIFSKIIYENIIELIKELEISEDFYNPIIITIPSTRLKKIMRGYNQNDLVIKDLMSKLPNRFIHWERKNLIKIKNTRAQSKIKDKEKRLRNVMGSFSIKKVENIKGKNIIIFDDIVTTGATLKEAKKVLKKAGAKKVISMVLAH